MLRGAIAIFFTVALAGICEDLAPELLLLSRIKRAAQSGLNDVPDYACTETVERLQSVGRSSRMHLVDKLDLEVAEIGGHEVFARAGDRSFSNTDLRKFVPTGLTATGQFSMHARSVFTGPATMFQYEGPERHAGRKTVRYYFKIAPMFANYQLNFNYYLANVGAEGAFWADAETHDLIELEIRATEIPPPLELRSAVTRIQYARGRLDGRSFLVPASSTVTTVSTAGYQSENKVTVRDCRKFQSETSITF